MNLLDWLNAQIDTCKNCVDILDQKRDNPDHIIIQLWALKKHIDGMIDYMERNKRYG